MILGLQREGLIDESEAWAFWDLPAKLLRLEGRMPLQVFRSNEHGVSDDLARHVGGAGQPDILWVEGRRFPPNLHQILELCPDSFKVFYSQNWKPWEMEGLDGYDLCLVDEEWQVRRVKKRYPDLHCAVWDKLIDYETGHYPIDCEKTYDLCYAADLRPRKDHELLFQAMAKVTSRKLTAVCLGGDYKGGRARLERLVDKLGVSVEFTGELRKPEVNAQVNRSRIGVIAAKRDAAPRIILEYMASGVPLLVNAELRAGTRYAGAEAGLLRSPEEFHLGIEEILDNYDRFSPRRYFLEHFSREQVISKFLGILEDAGMKLGAGKAATRTAQR